MSGGLIKPKVLRLERPEPLRRHPRSVEIKLNTDDLFTDLNISKIDFEEESEETQSEIFSILNKLPNKCGRNTPPRIGNPLFKNIQENNVYL
jgi:hypothetical protein